MAEEDILDLRDEHGYVEVYPISTRHLTASVWFTGGNASPEPNTWPPEDSPQWFAFTSNTDGSVDYGNGGEIIDDGTPMGAFRDYNSYMEGWARELDFWFANVYWDDNEETLYAARGQVSESQLVNGLVYFDLEGLPQGEIQAIELVFTPHVFPGGDEDNLPLAIEYYDQVGSYTNSGPFGTQGEGEQPNPFDDYTNAPTDSPIGPLIYPGETVNHWSGQSGKVATYPDTEFGKPDEHPGLRWALPIENDGQFTPGYFRGLRFIVQSDINPPLGHENWFTIWADYNHYDEHIAGDGLREAGWWLPHLRIRYGGEPIEREEQIEDPRLRPPIALTADVRLTVLSQGLTLSGRAVNPVPRRILSHWARWRRGW